MDFYGAWKTLIVVIDHYYEFYGKPNNYYSIRIRAIDKTGNASGYELDDYQSAAWSIAPPSPYDVKAASGFGTVWLNWSDPGESYGIVYYEVEEDIDGNINTYTVKSTSFMRSDLPNGQLCTFKVRAVDASYNEGYWSNPVEVTTSTMPEPKRYQIVGLTITPNHPSTNKLHWTACDITYAQPGQAGTTKSIISSSATWVSETLYLYYVEGDTYLRTTTSIAQVFTQFGYPIAAYHGGNDVRPVDGKVMIDGDSIIAGTIGANQLVANDVVITGSAQIANAIINDAKIVDLDAGKIKADTVLADSIKVGNDTLSTIKDNASNPVPAINNGSTLIDPGKILISGGTSLADWRMGGDTTKIDGGNIAANTIAANKLTIGSRGIIVDGVTFEHNKPSLNHVSWTTGNIHYTDDDDTSKIINITAGSAEWTQHNVYIYWPKGATSLQTADDFSLANQPDNVILALYKGGVWLDANYGRTVIEGNQIKTGSITANQIQAEAITAQQIAANAITAQHIQANAIVSDKIAADAVTADKILAGAITADKIAAGAITADLFAAGSIHGDKIQAGTLDADRIAAGTITADKIMAETVEAGNIKPAAITQVATGSGTNFSLTLNIEHGNALIMAYGEGSGSKSSGQGGHISLQIGVYENGVYITNVPLVGVSVTTQFGNSGNYTTTITYSGTLLHSRTVTPGWKTYTFQVNASKAFGSVSAVIMNYKR